ncbi:glucose-6-phosphate isomerase [Gryllotalpicola protaetiae]|uniref:Glucose-6-phosphate isomerase n=1 Tax=Gryllotalpicola protaetiae TaxID=2419771 RepID=A0A387BUV6_9MICO|nr:glucose-6-phosphate isomerase [Gryllotalpicola protaetiae]AYG04866.1 glucose-6-phosphate isomerase [Gryllotalpicola protaetiae]
MTVQIHVSGAVKEAVEAALPALVTDLVASGVFAQDPTLWGPDAESEASKRLGWIDAVNISRPLVADIYALRDKLRAAGVNHIVLGGMGGSSLAPEVITNTEGVELTILDTTDPGQVLAAIGDRLATTAVVVSSKSGGTLETDSHKRIYEKSFRDAGIDPLERIAIVTDPGSPLDVSAREAGYTVFNADPNVGGRYSALTAFGLVPSGLAGVDLDELLLEAEAVLRELAVDDEKNPGLILGAAMASKGKLGIVTDGSPLVGFGDWAEQLIAESTGKLGTGVLPVVLGTEAPELDEGLADLQIARLVEDATEFHLLRRDRHEGEILVSGSLGSQFVLWEFATAVAGRLLGINPFDQPDVEAAKVAARALLDATPEPTAPVFTDSGIEVRATEGLLAQASDLDSAIGALLAQLPDGGYVAVQAYVDRLALPQLAGIRDLIAARAKRPVTFGWGPRFLHSTGQFHKGGPAVGVFLQITSTHPQDLQIPDRPFTFGQLINAQAAGDGAVLAEHGRPVLTLNLTDPEANITTLFSAVNE